MTSRVVYRAAVTGTAFAAAAFIASRVSRPGRLAHVDQAAFAAVRSWRRPAGVNVARAISLLAEPGLTYPAAMVTGVVTSATVAALLVGGSRVYLGVHWPGDVLAGWLFAIGWLGLTESLPILTEFRSDPETGE